MYSSKTGTGPQDKRTDSTSCSYLHLCQELPLSGAWLQLSLSPRGSLEVEGNLLHPCRGLPCSRDEAWAHRPHRQRDARLRHCHPRPPLREGHLKHSGGAGAWRTCHSPRHRRRYADTEICRPHHHSARHARMLPTSHRQHPPATACLPHRRLQRQGC